MRPYRLIFYFFKCYLDRVQYPLLMTLIYYFELTPSQGVLPEICSKKDRPLRTVSLMVTLSA